MRIPDLLTAGPTWSIEFFPPKTEEAEEQFARTIAELAPLEPSFASVTYGALGSTKDSTRDIVVGMNADHAFPTMAHLTCVGHTRDEIRELLDVYADNGVRNILALGGDPPADGSPMTGEFTYASDLVDLVRSHRGDFSVGVAAHPEVHPRSPDRISDRRQLAAKLERADFAITQFFFGVQDYVHLMDELADLGCERPVIPGVMPFISGNGLRRMAKMNGTHIPGTIDRRLDDDPEAITRLGVEVATELTGNLFDAGAPGVHLYTLNRSPSVMRVRENLGLGAAR